MVRTTRILRDLMVDSNSKLKTKFLPNICKQKRFTRPQPSSEVWRRPQAPSEVSPRGQCTADRKNTSLSGSLCPFPNKGHGGSVHGGGPAHWGGGGLCARCWRAWAPYSLRGQLRHVSDWIRSRRSRPSVCAPTARFTTGAVPTLTPRNVNTAKSPLGVPAITMPESVPKAPDSGHLSTASGSA